MNEDTRELLKAVLGWIQDGCPEEEREAAEGTILYILAD